MKILRLTILAVTLSFLSLPAQTMNVDVDVEGVESWDEFGSPNNTVLQIDMAARIGAPPGTHLIVTGSGWDVTITPFGDSFYEEADMAIIGSDLVLTPGLGDFFSGSGIPRAYSSDGIIDFTDNGLDDVWLPDGILTLEFYEFFDDVPNEVDAIWGGTVTFKVVIPIPAAAWLFASALGLLGWVRRRNTA